VTRTRTCLLLALLQLAGCDETVGFLSVEMTVTAPTPPLSCDADPRRAAELSFVVSCSDGTTIERTYAVADNAASLPGVPLSSCTITITARNAHGRAVLSGSTGVLEVAEGENEPVSVTLVPELCEPLSDCDADGDGVADSDELALGIDPNLADSDGDGLDDGFELLECCSDASERDEAECKLLIQSVFPSYGTAGDTVFLKTTATIVDPQAKLGGAPLLMMGQDTRTFFGLIDDAAVLGPISLTSEGATAVFQDLFAVLRHPPEPVFKIHQEAGADGALMQQLVDLAPLGPDLWLLGRSGPASGPEIQAKLPIIVRYDRGTDHKEQLTLPMSDVTPIGLAVDPAGLAVLLEAPSGPLLVFVPAAAEPSPPVVRQFAIKGEAPVAVLIEPGGAFAQVLLRDAIARIDLSRNDTDAITPTALPGASLARGSDRDDRSNGAGDQSVFSDCTGLAYLAPSDAAAGQGYSYLSCHAPCEDRPQCKRRGTLLRVGPVKSCLAALSAGAPRAACWTVFTTDPAEEFVGAPVVDHVRQQVYQLTRGSGVVSAPFGRPGPLPRLMPPLIPFKWQGRDSTPRVMQLHQASGQLFVVDGPQVRRLEPRAKDLAARFGRSFPVGMVGEEATLITLTPDEQGSVLDVALQNGGSFASLFSVCRARCSGCLCRSQ